MNQNPYASPVETASHGPLSTENRLHTFAISEELQRASASQFFYSVSLSWRWLAIVLFVALGVFAAFANLLFPAGMMIGFALTTAITWAKAYQATQQNAMLQLRLARSSEITLAIEDAGLVTKFGDCTRLIRWSNISGVKSTKDFVYLLHGRSPLAAIPKSVLSEQLLESLLALRKPDLR